MPAMPAAAPQPTRIIRMRGLILSPPLYGEGYGAIVGLLAGDTSSIVNGSIFYGEGNQVWFLALFLLDIPGSIHELLSM